MSQLLRGTNGGSANINGLPSSFDNSLCSPVVNDYPQPSNPSPRRPSNEDIPDRDAFTRGGSSSGKGSSSTTNGLARVSRMPYTTPSGESGWYTGTVNDSGQPQGKGRLRCKTGNKVDGQWENGYSSEFMEREGRMKSGFGTNVAAWKDDPRNEQRLSGGGRRDKSRERPPSAAAAAADGGQHYLSSSGAPSMGQYPSAAPGQYAQSMPSSSHATPGYQYPSHYGRAATPYVSPAGAAMYQSPAGDGYYQTPQGSRMMHPMSRGQHPHPHSSGYHQ